MNFRFPWILGIFGLLAAPFLFIPLTVQAASEFTSQIYAGLHKVSAIDTEHFTLEFSAETGRGADLNHDNIPDLIERAAEYAEWSWDKEVKELGFPNPLEQYNAFAPTVNQEKIFVILDDLETYLREGSVGATSILPDGSLFMAVDPANSDPIMKVTMAHEFLHVIQFSYQGDFMGYDHDLNFAEQTAVAIEDYVYDDVNDYWNYLHHFLDYPDFSVFTGVIPEESLFEYGLGLWPRFVVEYLDDDWSFLVKLIETYFDEPVPDLWDAYEAYDNVLREEYDTTVSEMYIDFALTNYLRGYEEGENYPDVFIHATHAADAYPVVAAEVAADQVPALFGTNYLQFEVDSLSWNRDFELTVEKPVGVEFWVGLLMENATNNAEEWELAYQLIPADYSGGVTTTKLSSGTDRVTVMVIPVSDDPKSLENPDAPFELGYPYVYSAQIGSFLDDGELYDEALMITEEAVEISTKEGEEAGSNLPEGGVDISQMDELTVHELSVTGKDEDSVSLNWTRVVGESVAGYTIYYGGIESGNYPLTETIEAPHITHATLRDLVAGQTYYFAVKAFNEEGVESNTYSNEVEVSLALFKGFPDVPDSHSHYNAVRYLTLLNVFEGYPDGTFGPDRAINRAELMKILTIDWVEAAFDGDGPLPEGFNLDSMWDCFPDVGPYEAQNWFAPYVCYAYYSGWVEGYDDGLFHPERAVTKAEALKMILNAAEIAVPERASPKKAPYTDLFGAAWYTPYVVMAYELGYLEDPAGPFNPDQGHIRSAVAELLFRYLVTVLMDASVYNEELLGQFEEQWGEVLQR